MKLRYILSAFAVVALAFTACQREDATSADLANATVSNSYVRIPLDGSAQPTIKLTTSDEWTFVVKVKYDTSYTDAVKGSVKTKIEVEQLKHKGNEWLSISPLSGKGDATITFSAPETDTPRTLDVLLKVGDATQHVIVRQEELTAQETPISTCADVAAKGGSFRVKGTCVSITSESYGNWYLVDEHGDAVYIYGTVDATGSYNWSSFGIAVGDVVTIEGPKHPSYTGTWDGKTVPELVDVQVIKVEKALLAADKSEVAISSAAGETDVLFTQKGEGLSIESKAPWLTIKNNGYTVNSKGKVVVTVVAEENTTGKRRTGEIVVTSNKLEKGALKTSSVPVSIIQLVPETKGDLSDIADAIKSGSNKNPLPFDVTIPKSTVTYVNGSNTFLESETSAILIYGSAGLSVGQTVEGRVFGEGYAYNNLPEATVFNTSLAKIGKAPLNPAELPQPKEITLASLLENWDANFGRLLKIKGLSVTDAIAATYEVVDPETGKKVSGDRSGKLSDGTNTIAAYMQVKKYLEMPEGKKFDVICIPTINKTTKQLGIWDPAHVTEVE